MPGLVRGVGRTAVVAGTATGVSNRVSRRQGNRWAQEEADKQINEAVTRAPDSSMGLRARAALRRRDGKLDEALEAYQAALKVDPSDYRTYREIAMICRRQNKLGRSEAP